MDLLRGLLFAAEGKDPSVFGVLVADFAVHYGDPEGIIDVGCDLTVALLLVSDNR